MTTKPITSHRLTKDGKLVAKPPRMAAGQKRNKAMKQARQEKAWKAKAKR